MVARACELISRLAAAASAHPLRGAGTAAVCLIALTAVGGSQHAAARPGERPKLRCIEGDVLAQTREARLVRVGMRLYGCTLDQRRRLLAWWQPPAGAKWSRPALTGQVAAFQLESARSFSHSLWIVDLRRQKICKQATVGTGRVIFGDAEDAGEPLADLVLRRSGSVAFIAGPGQGPRTGGQEGLDDIAPWSGYEVVLIDRQGMRQVAAGPDIDPTSLEIDGSTVSWMESGEARSATLERGRRCTLPLVLAA